MENLQDLKALLIHEVMDVYSAEEQIIDSLPLMIESATNPKLKKALQDHLKVTKTHKQRLDKIQQLLKVGDEQKGTGKKGGLFGLFGGGQKCKGMAGIISEGNSIIKEDIDDEVLDAAIIASCQKVEHYEICSYGTLKAYAEELKLTQIVTLLSQTLEEEYEADFLLTELAVFGGVNEEAETIESRAGGSVNEGRSAAESRGAARESRASSPAGSGSKSNSTAKKSASAKKSTPNASKSKTSGKKSSTAGKTSRSK